MKPFGTIEATHIVAKGPYSPRHAEQIMLLLLRTSRIELRTKTMENKRGQRRRTKVDNKGQRSRSEKMEYVGKEK